MNEFITPDACIALCAQTLTRDKERVLQAVIEHLAADVAQLESDVVVYREMMQVTLAQNVALLKNIETLQKHIAERREEMRRYTSSMVRRE